MLKRLNTFSLLMTVIIITFTIFIAFNAWAKRGGEGGRGDGPVIFVTSQGLYYDSIVTADPLSSKGPFQQLFPPGTNPDYLNLEHLSTEYGPGNPGYVGGRWWVDVNGNGEMDDSIDHFFSCPLLGPGRAAAP
ncbi:MAG: hypothetical protein ACYS0I_12450 [Planctomycetota bacterium]|jgi:hypothetical protein